ncbi:HAD family hydrolase [Candidatus Gottesmanbacteria bacterium]|nr:HAD family hydrolase [Candidatus Gottesmanbacteria bacterium]
MFTNIKVLIWDFDGTLFKPNEGFFSAVREAEFQVLMKHRSWTRTKAEEEFQKMYKVVYPSATQTIGVLADITTAQAAQEMENLFDRRNFVSRDDKLIALFAKLINYRHIMFGNGIMAKHKETLPVLGISPDTFELYVTSEVVGKTKPSPDGFQYILDYTKLPADEHLMIGDRDLVDLAPAQALGMHTCLVWSNTPGIHADITIPTIYDIESLLSSRA